MSAEQALLDAYSEWRRLAVAGRKAIGLRDWNFFSECQEAVKKIQPLITNLTLANGAANRDNRRSILWQRKKKFTPCGFRID